MPPVGWSGGHRVSFSVRGAVAPSPSLTFSPPVSLRLLLALAWFLVSGGLTPAAIGGAVHAGPPAATRSISAAEHQVDLPRPGERVASDWGRGGARSPVPQAPGSADRAAPACLASPEASAARLASFPATAARTERPRRVRFPTEATAPPSSLS